MPEIHQGDGSRIAGLRAKRGREAILEDFERRSAEAKAKREAQALLYVSKPVPEEEIHIEPGLYMARSHFLANVNNTSMFFEPGQIIPPDRPDLLRYLLHEKFDVGLADEATIDRWNHRCGQEDEDVLQVANLHGTRCTLYAEIYAQKLAERQQLQTQ